MRELDSLLAAVALALPYILGKRIDAVHVAHRRRWISMAAGISVAYVFVHMLPELSERQVALLEALGDQRLPFAEAQVYLAALLGFVLFYGLDSMIVLSRTPEHATEHTHRGGNGIYWIHMGGFTAYCAMVSYLVVDWTRGVQSLVLYAVALTLHFLVIDHSLRIEYGVHYDRTGRWLLAASVFIGWLIGMFAPLEPAPLAILMGFISGGVVINSAKDELPQAGQGRFVPFALGAFAYSLLLLV